MNKIIIIVLSILSAMHIDAQSIGYIHRDSVLRSVPGYSAALADLAKAERGYKNEVAESTAAAQQKFKTLMQSYKVSESESVEELKKRMKPADTMSLNLLLAEEQMIAKKANTYQSMLQEKQNRELFPIISAVNEAISKYAKANKLDAVYVLEAVAPQLAYLNESKVITGPIIAIVSKLKVN